MHVFSTFPFNALALARFRRSDIERSEARTTNVGRVRDMLHRPEMTFSAKTGALDLALALAFSLKK